MKIGISALQGDFERHVRVLKSLGVDYLLFNKAGQLGAISGLILPGGESTTMLKLLEDEGLFEPVLEFGQTRPIFVTCAGTILLASEVTCPAQRSFGLMDLTVERNAYGRQLDSSIRRVASTPEFDRRTAPGEIEAVFIRAPIIRRVGEGATVLLADGGDPILVEQGRHLAATFHPELTGDQRVHRLFLDKVRESQSG
jgi:5'-phosphate synthase pdxT subunit